MEQAVKYALSGFLLVLVYSLFVFLDTQKLIIPFPLFSFILLGVVLVQRLKDKPQGNAYSLLLLMVIFRCLSNPLTYTFFLAEDTYASFLSGRLFFALRVLETLSVIPFIIQTLGFQNRNDRWIVLGLLLWYVSTLLIPIDLLPYLFFLGMAAVLLRLKRGIPLLPILWLIGVFDLLEGISQRLVH